MSEQVDARSGARPARIAVVGGGPGGLMVSYRLQRQCSRPFEITIYEASPRLGGKILTQNFTHAPVRYEAGAAELYDYSHVGEDPLRELVQELGLAVQPMSGTAVILENHVFQTLHDLAPVYGQSALQDVMAFDANAKRWMSAEEFYEADRGQLDDGLERRTFHDELARVPNEDARRYLRIMVHSDLATEPHRTSASYGLQNYLMNDPDYLQLYTIDGGIECLTQALATRTKARLLLQEKVTRVERVTEDRLRVFSAHGGAVRSEVYDYVVIALPNGYISAIEWAGDTLAHAMHRHHVHHEYPAHYLRVSVLFREVFWQNHLEDTFFMLDAFGGCCLYDESSRNGCQTFGVLGWLIAGDAAMVAANHSDEDLVQMMLDSLPAFLQHGRGLFIEGKVHRWIGAVNGLPGGLPPWDIDARHIPDPSQPNLLMVGDYLFDSTLNGVLDSADYVADCLAANIEAAFKPDTHLLALSAGS